MGVPFDPSNGSTRQRAGHAGEFPPDGPPGFFEPPKPRRNISLIVTSATAGVAIAGFLGLFAWAESSGGFTNRDAQVDANDNVTRSGTLNVAALKVGGCFDEPSTARQSTVSGIEAIPCAQPHDAQVIGLSMLDDDSYVAATVQSEAGSACQKLAAGATVDRARLGRQAGIVYFAPTASSWANFDRRVTCAVDDGPGTELTGSVMK